MSKYAVLMSTLAACGGGSGGNPDAFDPCQPRWTVETSIVGAFAVITNGQLALDSPSVPAGPAVAVSRTIEDRDFDVTFQVDQTTLGGVGSYVRAAVDSPEGGTYLQLRQHTADEVRVESQTEPIGVGGYTPTTARLMTLRFARTGDKFEALATAGSDLAGISDFTFTAMPLTLKIEIGGSAANTGATGARFASFDVAAGTLTADPFDCNTLAQ